MSEVLSPASLMAASNGPAALLDQVGRQLVELGPRQLQVEVLGALAGGGDEGQVDLGLLHAGQLDLGLLGRFLQPLHGHLVGRQVDPLGVLELVDQPVHDLVVPVVATELGVPRGGLHLEDAVADLEHRDVEGPTAEVEDQHGAVGVLLVEPVGQRGRRRLVDDAQDLEPGDRPGLLGGRPLGVVEVGRHGDDRLGHGVAQVRLGVPLELAQDPGRDLLGLVLLAVDVDGPVGAHVALDRADGPVGVGDGLALGHLAHQYLAGLGEAHDRRRRPPTLGIGDDDGLARLQHADHRVGGPQVDSDGLSHPAASFRSFPSTACRSRCCLSTITVANLSVIYIKYSMTFVKCATVTAGQDLPAVGGLLADARPVGGAAAGRYHRAVLDLVLLRHGQSTWNAENLFTGWVDVDLTPTGEAEARAGGRAPGRTSPGSTCGSCTPRCSPGPSAPPSWPSTRPGAAGSRSAATGG